MFPIGMSLLVQGFSSQSLNLNCLTLYQFYISHSSDVL